MVDSDPDVASLYADYRRSLTDALAAIEPWWTAMRDRCTAEALRRRWPARRAGHPAVLGVYARYHRAMTQLLDARRRAPVVALAFDDDAAWGDEAEPEPRTLIPVEPRAVLVDRLHVDAPQLYGVLVYMLLSPVAELPDPLPTARGLTHDAPPLGWRPPPATIDVETTHGVEVGLERLLNAPSDLRRGRRPRPPIGEASEGHQMAHAAYARALEGALSLAERWWSSLDPNVRVEAFPCGPVSHPRVVGVVQAYWALVEELATLQPRRAVDPEWFLLGWLLDGRHTSWVRVLTAMPYWPIPGVEAVPQERVDP